MAETIDIAGRPVGPGQPPYIVAELSANHLGDIDRALAIMQAASAAGADAVKLQTYTADTLTIDHDGDDFRIGGGLWDGRTLYELYREAFTPWEWHARLFEEGRRLGITVFSSPFDASAVDFLDKLDCPALKIASFELVDLPLIAHAAATGRPLIMSTGLATHEEIGAAVKAAREAGCTQLALLHCVSAYPAAPADSHLRTLPDIAASFGVPAGLSDHTPGSSVAVAAVALGAVLIEKHVTLSRADGGPDGAFSLEPDELARLVTDCRVAWEALGQINYAEKEGERGNRIFRRSLYVVEDMAPGEAFSASNVRSIRPGYGLAPAHLPGIIGRCAARALRRGTPLTWAAIEGGKDA